jgi:hypothetical protein
MIMDSAMWFENSRVARCFLSFALGLVFFTRLGFADSDPARESVLKGLGDFRQSLEKGLHVKYDVTRHKKGGSDLSDYWSLHIGLTGTNGFLRVWSGEHALSGARRFHFTVDPDSKSRDRSIRVYDGTGYAVIAQGGDFIPALTVTGSSNQSLPEEDLYFELLGFESSRSRVKDFYTFKGFSGIPYDLVVVARDQDYVLRSTADGLISLSKQNFDDIFLDPTRGFVLVERRRCWEAGGQTMAKFKNSDFREVDSGVWVPMTSKIEYFDGPLDATGSLMLTADLVVKNVSVQPDESLFKLNLGSGKSIVDLATGEVISLAGRSDELIGDRLRESALRRAVAVGSGGRVIVFLNFLAALVIVSIILIARRKYS